MLRKTTEDVCSHRDTVKFLNSRVCKLTVTFTCADGKRRCLFRRELFLFSFGHRATTPVPRNGSVLNIIVRITRYSLGGYLCSVLNCAMYLVRKNILSIRNRASGLPESSLRALVADAMKNSPASDALPPHPWKHDGHRIRGASIFMSARHYHVIPARLRHPIASEDLPSQYSLAMGCQPSPACVARVSVHSPLFFCAKESSDCP